MAGRAFDFKADEISALGRTLNKFRDQIRKMSWTANDFKNWQEERTDLDIKIPTGKNYLSQFVRRGILEKEDAIHYRFRKNGTDPITGQEIAMAIKAARKAANEATRKWNDKKKVKASSKVEEEIIEAEEVEFTPIDRLTEAIQLLKLNGYRVFAPRTVYDEI